jgi:hypothetical protein
LPGRHNARSYQAARGCRAVPAQLGSRHAVSVQGDRHGEQDRAAGGAAAADGDVDLGKAWCVGIRAVQKDLSPDAASAAYLAQLVLEGDPEETAKLSAAVVDAATKKECPTEYAKILEQAEITSLVDVGMQP